MKPIRTIPSALLVAGILALAGCGHSNGKAAQSNASSAAAPNNPGEAAAGQPASSGSAPTLSNTQQPQASQYAQANAGTQSPAQPADSPAQNQPPEVTIPPGTPVEIRLNQSLGSFLSVSGQIFAATLDAPIVVDNTVVVPQGVNVRGRVLYAKRSGRLKGPAELSITLTSLDLSGQQYRIVTSHRSWRGRSHKRRDLAWIGGGGGAGSLVGLAAGGGVGAAIGAGVGAGGGTVGAFVTGRKNIFLRSETRLRFVLRQPVSLSQGGGA